jgi:hypothetical protein
MVVSVDNHLGVDGRRRPELVPQSRSCSPADLGPHTELVVRLCRSTGLPGSVAVRVLDDVLAFFDETIEDYVRRRHSELQRRDLTNDRIFDQVAAELPHRRFAGPPLSRRQLRRLVYG